MRLARVLRSPLIGAVCVSWCMAWRRRARSPWRRPCTIWGMPHTIPRTSSRTCGQASLTSIGAGQRTVGAGASAGCAHGPRTSRRRALWCSTTPRRRGWRRRSPVAASRRWRSMASTISGGRSTRPAPMPRSSLCLGAHTRSTGSRGTSSVGSCSRCTGSTACWSGRRRCCPTTPSSYLCLSMSPGARCRGGSRQGSRLRRSRSKAQRGSTFGRPWDGGVGTST
mmetsp:Transcript_10892/g.31019  ORF Transcript_10892/g.31019 Transcript_10892/m.31019 type:complete len:224 (+) Transcript_10892:204-875(+)